MFTTTVVLNSANTWLYGSDCYCDVVPEREAMTVLGAVETAETVSHISRSLVACFPTAIQRDKPMLYGPDVVRFHWLNVSMNSIPISISLSAPVLHRNEPYERKILQDIVMELICLDEQLNENQNKRTAIWAVSELFPDDESPMIKEATRLFMEYTIRSWIGTVHG